MARPIYVTPPPEMLQYSPILEECVLLVNLVNLLLLHGLRNTCTIQMVLEPNGYMLRCENIQADLRLSISHGSITLRLMMLLNMLLYYIIFVFQLLSIGFISFRSHNQPNQNICLMV